MPSPANLLSFPVAPFTRCHCPGCGASHFARDLAEYDYSRPLPRKFAATARLPVCDACRAAQAPR